MPWSRACSPQRARLEALRYGGGTPRGRSQGHKVALAGKKLFGGRSALAGRVEGGGGRGRGGAVPGGVEGANGKEGSGRG